MKKAMFILLIAGISFSSCFFQREKADVESENGELATEEVVVPPLIVSPILQQAIDNTIDYLSSRNPKFNSENYAIYLVFSEPYLYIVGQDHYYKEQIKGYGYYNNYTVILNNIKENEIHNFVDFEQLILFTDTIPGFMDRFDKYEGGGDVDPFGIKYKIIDNDSLVLEHKGML